MSYTLIHTAEQIDHKLELVNENKNLLPYPYKTAFPVGLEDVGDGSFLTTGNTTSNAKIFLNDCSLLAGTYIASLEVTDITDSHETVTNPGFGLKIVIDGTEQPASFTLSDVKVASVYLAVPDGCSTKNLLIKPQIEASAEKTDWVPYMDKIGNYVDGRFNSTNTKIKVLTERLNALERLLADGEVLLVKE
jgi:hypothetical protein